MSQRNEILGVFLGIILLICMHILAILAIVLLSFIRGIYGGQILIIGGFGFFLWQLLYVIPVTLWLKRRRQYGLMKGVIIGAVITALLNGGCSLLFSFQGFR
jgi:Na+/proline symporter